MKKCPEKEILMACIDGELDQEELAQVQLHLKSCQNCAAEVHSMTEDEKILRSGVDEVFSRHRVNARVMTEIRNLPKPVSENHAMPFWRRILLPALAIGLVLLAIVFMSPDNHRFQGSAEAVSFHALNSNSTVNGSLVDPDRTFNLSPCCRQNLDGSFLFSTGSEVPARFSMQGRALVSLADQGFTVFENAAVKLELTEGVSMKIMVNDLPVELSAGQAGFQNLSASDTSTTAMPSSQTASSTEQTQPPAYQAVSEANKNASTTATTENNKMPAEQASATATAAQGTASSSNLAIEQVIPSIDSIIPASGVEHITNPFTEQPLGEGR